VIIACSTMMSAMAGALLTAKTSPINRRFIMVPLRE